MKGGFYGLSIKQLTLFLAAVAFTVILLFGWAKTPGISSLMLSQSAALKLPPDEKIKEQEVSKGVNGSDGVNPSAKGKDNSTDAHGEIQGEEVKQKQVPKAVNGSEGVRPSADKLVSFNSTNTTMLSGANEKKNLTGKHEEIQENTTKQKDNLGIKQFVEGEEGSKLTKQNSVAPMSSVPTNSSLTGEDVKARRKNHDCNYAKGKWITDDNRPLYSGFGCKQWLSSMWACRLTQRTDFEFEKLRWQPKDCEMENFTGSKFLKRMQNKTVAFIGDSLGRQQFQSLMCMVTEGELRQDVSDVGWEFGLVKAPGHVRPDGWAYRFPSTNTTILYYWSASLCDLEPLNITNPVTDYAMHLDRPPAFLQRFLPRFDVLVLNTGHHWNRGKLQANRWIMHVGGKPNNDKNIADIPGAKNFTIYSIVNWVNSELPKHPGLKAFYRTISPRHFFNGDWNTGGTCDNTTPRSGNLEVLQDESSDPTAAGSVKGTKVKLLDITAVSQLRDEGHISRYSIKATPGMQDCLHWCLPGVPDSWNEILFAQL